MNFSNASLNFEAEELIMIGKVGRTLKGNCCNQTKLP